MQQVQHVFIVGAKGFTYGGYETFLNKLTEYHQSIKDIQYHIACKANGKGMTDEKKLTGVEIISDTEYMYHNAHCFKIKSPEIGPAQAIIYDILALEYCVKYIKQHKIGHPIVYVLSSRVGPVIGRYARIIHKLGGCYYNNPDGRESLRLSYKWIVRKYWTFSERRMIKHSDLVICDSTNIEKYIQEEYEQYHPKTTYIAYGCDIVPSNLSDDDPKYVNWLKKNDLIDGQMYVVICRCVVENSFETMLREFMKSKSDKDLVLITNTNEKLYKELEDKLHFEGDKRIKFVGTVYDQELLRKIREKAYAYLHGHTVGGTNPSLIEALGSTKLNLLVDVCFNKEVAGDCALYWSREEGSLSTLIDKADRLPQKEIEKLGRKARQRVDERYTWDKICGEYKEILLHSAR